ncbi:GTP pyrophosphokinase family protein [Pseudomonas sp. Irchel s3b2]|uniref:GTP pyrophosphokinase n=1 Tax=Pseudomonas sp. Irchel s3b2 TaxID=2009073 RepID=UPI000BA2E5F7|nr:RelA/SpoT domain-containing protein [Pseudomonas sp. Irchel s3b2]
MDNERLRIQYQNNIGRAERLRDVVIVQLLELFNFNNITLGVPIESRIKNLDSISEKIERKDIDLENLLELQDLIGIRSILLFKRDLIQVSTLISETFEVVSSEDTSDRLSESEFGYQSQHYIVKIPKTWLSLPSLAGLDEFFIELQVRTLAQHIWAAASHKLQYKQEAGVPPPVRRAINRVSALLETVDLEFERVLNEREEYVEHAQKSVEENETLNVDNLARVISEILPAQNKSVDESYAGLLQDLHELNIVTTQDLKDILTSHLSDALNKDKEKVAEVDVISRSIPGTEAYARLERGVYFTHVGLVRQCLRTQFGSEVLDRVMKKNKEKLG